MARLRVFIRGFCIGGSPNPGPPQQPLSNQWHCVGGKKMPRGAHDNSARSSEREHPFGSHGTQPLVTTGAGVGYFPSGALPTGNLPIGALPTGATGGGGSLRGRSAAAAALSMAKDAAVTTDRIFSITIPLDSGWGNRRGTLPASHHHP